ncbi:MAG TPA: MFS transporter [Chloroflexota bacterium]|nr:MFS transporter [Chloroflexota bacterium]
MVPPAARASRSLVAALLLVRLADEWFSFLPAGAFEALRADLRLSYAEAGLVLAALPAGGLAGNGLTAAADFVDRRRLASVGALVYGLCLLTFAVSDSFLLLLAAGFLWGAAGDAFVHGCEVALVELYRDDPQRGLAAALGRANAYGAVGDLLGPLTLTGAALLGLSWRAVCAGGGLLMLGYAGWIAVQAFPVPRPHPAAGSPVSAVLAVVRDRRILLLAAADGLFGLLDEPFLAFTLAFLERTRQLVPAVATTVIGVVVAAGLAGFLAVPLFTRRVASGPLLATCAALLLAAAAGLIVAPNVPLQLLAAFTFGLAGAAFYAVLQAIYLSLRPGQAGVSQAVVSTIGLCGIGFPALVGKVADAFGLTAGLGLYAAVPLVLLLLVLLLGVLGIVSWRAAPPP